MVTMRRINGSPSRTQRAMAAAVPTLWHTMPMSCGNPPEGTSLPVSAAMSCRSPPAG